MVLSVTFVSVLSAPWRADACVRGLTGRCMCLWDASRNRWVGENCDTRPASGSSSSGGSTGGGDGGGPIGWVLQKLFAPASPEELARKRRLAEELIRQQREMLKQERKLRKKLKVMLATFKSAQVERFKRQRKRQRADLEMRRASEAAAAAAKEKALAAKKGDALEWIDQTGEPARAVGTPTPPLASLRDPNASIEAIKADGERDFFQRLDVTVLTLSRDVADLEALREKLGQASAGQDAKVQALLLAGLDKTLAEKRGALGAMKKELIPVATQPSSPGGVVDARGVAPWKPGEREAALALSGSQSPRTRPKATEPPLPALQTAPSENRVLAMIAKLDCASVLDALAKTAPVAQIFGAVNQETASCVQEFGKGALCSVQESAKQWLNLAVFVKDAVSKHGKACLPSVLGSSDLTGAATAVVSCAYVREAGPRLDKMGQCLRALRQSDALWPLLADLALKQGCSFVGGLAADLVLDAATVGGGLPATLAKWLGKLKALVPSVDWLRLSKAAGQGVDFAQGYAQELATKLSACTGP